MVYSERDQHRMFKTVAFKEANRTHCAIFQHTGTDSFDRPQYLRSVRDLTIAFLEVLEDEKI